MRALVLTASAVLGAAFVATCAHTPEQRSDLTAVTVYASRQMAPDCRAAVHWAVWAFRDIGWPLVLVYVPEDHAAFLRRAPSEVAVLSGFPEGDGLASIDGNVGVMGACTNDAAASVLLRLLVESR